MTDHFEKQFTILLKEWDLCEAGIGRFDTMTFSVRSWSVTLFTAVLGAAATLKTPNIAYLGLIPTFLCWMIDALIKSYQDHFLTRPRTIQDHLVSSEFREALNENELNFGTPGFAVLFIGGLGRFKLIWKSLWLVSVWIIYLSMGVLGLLTPSIFRALAPQITSLLAID